MGVTHSYQWRFWWKSVHFQGPKFGTSKEGGPWGHYLEDYSFFKWGEACGEWWRIECSIWQFSDLQLIWKEIPNTQSRFQIKNVGLGFSRITYFISLLCRLQWTFHNNFVILRSKGLCLVKWTKKMKKNHKLMIFICCYALYIFFSTLFKEL